VQQSDSALRLYRSKAAWNEEEQNLIMANRNRSQDISRKQSFLGLLKLKLIYD
jgi:hypothetical protein